ncbi:MAG: DUF4232 domain-containing protein, partial [Candidatus Binatia bacterium]
MLCAMVVPATGTAATYVVTTTADGGPGSLRQAILDGNGDPALDHVAFAIVDPAVPRIMPASALPAISAPLEIDGTTQPSAGLVELDGSDTASVAGLTITGGGSTVRGLVINGFQTAAIAISGVSGNVIEGNLIGTDVDGLTGLSTSAVGIDVADSPGHRIGGVAPESRNVISGNNIGVYLHGAATVGNVIEGNFIGTEPSGFTAVANASHGVQVFLAGANTIGGTDPGAGNVISGNLRDGIAISSSGGIVVQGNAIGIGPDLLTAVPNLRHGVRAFTGTHDTLVGGAGPNVIAFNGGSGIVVAANAGTGNTVRANSVHDNGLLGIDIGASAPTPNDVGDADVGANLLQNFPVLDPLFSGGTKVSGVLDSVAGATFTIEVFTTSQCDATGYGEGAELVGTDTVSTDGTGHAGFTMLLDREVDATVEVLAATVTDAAGNTSELSLCAPPVPVTTTTTSSSTTSSSTTTTSAAASTTTAVPAVPTCATSQLAALVSEPDAGAGQRNATITFTNNGSAPCTMIGYIGMQLLAGNGNDIPTNVVRTPG